jgi:hypothetical protein
MSQSNQEKVARRFQAIDTEPSYECELPDDVRAEFARPKRPRILERPVQAPPDRRGLLKWLAAFGLPALILACVISSWQRERASAPERAKTNPAISVPTPLPTPQPITPSAQPTPGQARSWAEYIAQHPDQFPYRPAPALRATLVQSRAPRAILVKLPTPGTESAGDVSPLVVGQHYLATMPYDNGLQVLTTFKGWLPSQDDLPSHPNAIGDMYLVKNVPFVWVFAPNATHADWIDP